MSNQRNRIYKITSLALTVGLLSFIVGAGLGFLYATAEPIETADTEVQEIELTECEKTLSSKNGQYLTLAEDVLPEPIKYPRELTDDEFATVCGIMRNSLMPTHAKSNC